MAKRDKNRSYTDWEDDWGTPDNTKEVIKRDRRNQRLLKKQIHDETTKEEEE